MKENKIKRLQKDEIGKQLLSFIPNELGINLCSVENVNIVRQKNGEVTKITINFIPKEPEPKSTERFAGAVLA